MLKLLFQITGWLIARTPRFALRFLSWSLGHVVILCLPRRRRLFYSNLEHAFPNRTRAWQSKIAHESSCRVVETLLLSLASPFLRDSELRRIAHLGTSVESLYDDLKQTPRPVVYGTVHFAHWESETWLPLLLGRPMPETGVIFRPLDNPAVDAWVKVTRERFGLKLLSRKEGFQEALKILRKNGTVALLFDQNAGMQGALTTCFGRVCSTTELAGLLTEKFGADLYAFFPRRLGFWRIELNVQKIHSDGTAAGATVALNQWLETTLSADDNLCASWLWSHDRWRHQDMPEKRLRLESKRNLLQTEIALRGHLARRTRVFVRLPNWLGDVVMAVPLLRALRSSRPDAEVTVIGKATFLELLKPWNVADRYEPLPARGPGYFLRFWSWRRRYPDVYLLFTNSFRGDLEAWLTRAPQRFGIVRQKGRPLLTHIYPVPSGYDEREHHQFELWEGFLRAFGLDAAPDRTPLPSPEASSSDRLTVGFIAGSENTPEKRWPVEHWRTLLANVLGKHVDAQILLFGTANDRPITAAIAAGQTPPTVEDLAGRTPLPEYVRRLRGCNLLVTNDTGGMHLANALGVPIVALFGPTNPIRTGPVFAGPAEILQPEGCPKTGGASLTQLSPATVAEAVNRMLTQLKVGPTTNMPSSKSS